MTLRAFWSTVQPVANIGGATERDASKFPKWNKIESLIAEMSDDNDLF